MPSGHASHKGASTKPNTNAEGVINAVDDTTIEPHDIVTQGSHSKRTNDAPENAAATQRPANRRKQ